MKGLREEFYKEQCEPKDDSDRLGIYENDAELVADWWLAKCGQIEKEAYNKGYEKAKIDLRRLS